MIVRFVTHGATLALLLLIAFVTPATSADRAAADACAAKLPKDARAIFDKTLPQIGPGADLRSLVTANTRSLAFSGTIDRGSARQSAEAAGQCLKEAEN
jgi:hypothetical protein